MHSLTSTAFTRKQIEKVKREKEIEGNKYAVALQLQWQEDVLLHHPLGNAPLSSDLSHLVTNKGSHCWTSVSRWWCNLCMIQFSFHSSSWPGHLMTWHSVAALPKGRLCLHLGWCWHCVLRWDTVPGRVLRAGSNQVGTELCLGWGFSAVLLSPCWTAALMSREWPRLGSLRYMNISGMRSSSFRLHTSAGGT